MILPDETRYVETELSKNVSNKKTYGNHTNRNNNISKNEK